ncbi:hypothetical protein [Micromonospora sp. NBC_01813]|uniref:hypothetical protein n=1 Tax=Micromonospora sp. NBC_01813 TaxID=2975988 RepID=UPI002DD828F7|nr:hypothetical protein [Micromonospora sp. NBC_01813]WSA11311.1 hypothetical protein OG958_11300 [Micromonospora sp. NBC_01813]
MDATNIGRRAAAGAAALALAAGLTVAPGGPAHAGGFAPVRVEQVSDSDDSTTKTATATCPGARSVFAAGARVVNGDGGVVLTAMVPNPELTSVTVTAKARTGHAGDWSLTAYATCDTSTSPPKRTAVTVNWASTAQVSCPDDTRVVGTGFRFEGSVDHTYVDEVAFGPGLRDVRVHTGGDAEPASLTAFGICKEPTGPTGVRVNASSAYDGSWPKAAVTDDPGPDLHVYAVGARVVGSGEFFLSALVPNSSLRLAGAEAVQASQLPGAAGTGDAGRAGGADTGADGDGDGSLTVSGLLMAAFH